MDVIDGLIIGVATAVVATVVVNKYFNTPPEGGSSPKQIAAAAAIGSDPAHPLYVVDLSPTPMNAAPVAQVNPNTEAAYNVHPVAFEEAFGPSVNQPAEEAVLPQ